MDKNMADFSYFLPVLTPFNPPLYGVERGKPERSGGEPVPRPREGEYMKFYFFLSVFILLIFKTYKIIYT